MCSVVNRFTVATFCQFLKCTLKIAKDKGLFHEAMATVLKCIHVEFFKMIFFFFPFLIHDFFSDVNFWFKLTVLSSYYQLLKIKVLRILKDGVLKV